MTSTASRKRRGRSTELLIADHLRRNGFPHAEANAANRPGPDIVGTLGIDWEISARRGFTPLVKLAQQDARLPAGCLGVVILRPDGHGPTTIGTWPTVMHLDQAIALLHAAGYGGPTTAPLETR